MLVESDDYSRRTLRLQVLAIRAYAPVETSLCGWAVGTALHVRSVTSCAAGDSTTSNCPALAAASNADSMRLGLRGCSYVYLAVGNVPFVTIDDEIPFKAEKCHASLRHAKRRQQFN